MLIWADSFDHYGTGATGRTNMLQGSYANVGGASTFASPVNTRARTGDNSLRMSGSGTSSTANTRRVLSGSTRFTVGFGFSLYLEALPSINNRLGFAFVSPDASFEISASFQNDGAIEFRRGSTSGTVIGLTDAGIIGTGSFQHIEFAALIDPIVGWIELRAEGVQVFRIEDVNTGSDGVSSIRWGGISATGTDGLTVDSWWDDIFAWDDSGDVNNDFVGPARVLTLFAEADEATQDWSVVGVSPAEGFAAVNQVPPDGDTAYIDAAEVGEISEFTCPELPPEIVGVPGIYIPTMARLADAGIGRLRVSLVDDSLVEAGPEQSLTPVFTYRGSMFQLNPVLENIWTKERFEGAKIRVEKTL